VRVKVTIKEIAQISGVSLGTVDRALNGRTGINAETRERVLGVAKQLGYRPHLLARSLVTGSTKTIGVIVSNLRNSFFSEIVEVIQWKARASGYHVCLMLNEFYREEEEKSLDRLRSLNVDGIIMTPVSRGNAFVAYLKRLATPVITLSNRVSKSWPWVGIDEHAAVRDGVRYVLSKGYTRVLFVLQSREEGKVQSLYVDEQRVQGYRDSLAEAGGAIAAEVFQDVDLFRKIGEDPSFLGPRTCIVCSCDSVALEALNILKANGISVPSRVGLMGFDNVDELKYITPLLTTISYPFEQMGEVAFDSLMEAIKGRDVGSRTLSHTLIKGETV
jgi:LacI family transcriptional regulator